MSIFKTLNVTGGGNLPEDPLDLFEIIRPEGVNYLRPSQIDVLKNWHSNRIKRNVAIQLHTGAGKTLVGLLMLYSKMQEGIEHCVYFVPNRQLLDQVLQQAKKFNIPACEIIDIPNQRSEFPINFLNNNSILVCTFHRIFNAKSIFVTRNQKIGALVIDDAHYCARIAREQTTITFMKEESIYTDILALFSESLKHQNEGLFSKIQSNYDNCMMRIPYWDWIDNIGNVISKIEKYGKSGCLETDFRDIFTFKWPIVVEDLKTYNCLISSKKIEISPSCVPYHLFGQYSECQYKYLLSATFSDSENLVLDLGFSPDSLLNPIDSIENEIRDAGQRLILAPNLLNDNKVNVTEILKHYSQSENICVLLPNDDAARKFNQIFGDSCLLANAKNIDTVLQSLDEKRGQIVVFSNRYDGIDLMESRCRILLLIGLPNYDSLYESYMYRVVDYIKKSKQAQIIEQGLGRAVRSKNDFCVCILYGTDVTSFISLKSNLKFLTNYTRREVIMGTIGIPNQLSNLDQKAFMDLIDSCLAQNVDWVKFHQGYKDTSNSSSVEHKKNNEVLLKMYKSILEAWKLFRNNEYERASKKIQTEILETELAKNEMGYFRQLMANMLYPYNGEISMQIQLTARQVGFEFLLPKGINTSTVSINTIAQAANIAKFAKDYSSKGGFAGFVDQIINKLIMSEDSDNKVFEKKFCDLGKLLGFESLTPDESTGIGPDVIWITASRIVYIIEIKSKKAGTPLYKGEVEQILSSAQWFRNTYAGEYTIFHISVTPYAKSEASDYHPDNYYILDSLKLEQIKKNIVKFSTTIIDSDFRQDVIERTLKTHFFDAESFANKYLIKIK